MMLCICPTKDFSVKVFCLDNNEEIQLNHPWLICVKTMVQRSVIVLDLDSSGLTSYTVTKC
jgi:hypothetical protein